MATYNGNDNNNTYNGTAADDAIYGYGGDDTLKGAAGNDFIDGGDDNDTLTGGKGNDYLAGGYGGDTYVFSSGDGQDTIDNYYYDTDGNNDVVKFTNVASTAITARNGGEHLYINYGGTDQIQIVYGVNYQEAYYGNGIGKLQFSDGVTWTWENLLDQSLAGTAGNDTLIGYRDRADTLVGGKGDDYLAGYEGRDIYVFSSGDGQDTIDNYYYDNNGNDVVKFTNITLTDLTSINKDGDNSLIVSYGAGDKLTVLYHFDDPSYKISQFQFAGGDIINNAIIGTATNNSLAGSKANDAINGLGGADTMAGGLGNDLYFVDNIGDVVTEATAAGTDTVLTSISYTLTDTVENLALLAGAVTATGNAWLTR